MNIPKKIEKYFIYTGRQVSYVFTHDASTGRHNLVATYDSHDHQNLAINEAQRLNDRERDPDYRTPNSS